MVLGLLLALACQDSDPQSLRASADRLTERLQWITTTIKELREKRRVHPEALSEVETYLGTVTRTGTDLQGKAKQIEDQKRLFDSKQREYDDRERDWQNEKKLYDQQLERFNAVRTDLNNRWDKYRKEADALEARRSGLTNDQIDGFNRDVDRLNAHRSSLAAEDSRVESVDRPALNAAWEVVKRKRTEFDAVADVYFDLDTDYRNAVWSFRTSIETMERPAESLFSLLQEATGQRTASLAYRVFERRRDAEAITLAAAFGSDHDLPDGPFAQVLILRAAKDRASTREYIVEKLRLGELIESLRALTPAGSDKSAAADRTFEFPALAGLVSKPSALVKGATWTMSLPESSRLKPQSAAPLR